MARMGEDRAILGVAHSAPGFEVPAGACDCHTHVFGPSDRYPLDPGRGYTPGDALLEDLLALHDRLGIGRVVIVHPSPYGADNRATVDAVRALGDRGRGVAVIDGATTDEALRDMHAAGVRGVRVNLESAGIHDPAVAAARLSAAAARVAPLGWHLQTYTGLDQIAALGGLLGSLPVPLVVDHYGLARASAGPSQPGMEVLLGLLRSGRAYVKLSAPHRISSLPDGADAAPIARALAAANPERILWGSDWPHPGGRPGVTRDRERIEPFNPVDDGAALSRIASWLDDPALVRRMLVENPARLYDFPA